MFSLLLTFAPTNKRNSFLLSCSVCTVRVCTTEFLPQQPTSSSGFFFVLFASEKEIPPHLFIIFVCVCVCVLRRTSHNMGGRKGEKMRKTRLWKIKCLNQKMFWWKSHTHTHTHIHHSPSTQTWWKCFKKFIYLFFFWEKKRNKRETIILFSRTV